MATARASRSSRVTFPGACTAPDTGESLLRDARVIVVMARGGGYDPGTPREPYEFQTPYLGELGVRKLHFVAAELPLAGRLPHLAGLEELATGSLAKAREDVMALAAD
jgi:FMN-dependent NADH-azoreductase